MASFPSALSSPQKTTLRASGYWARVLACLNTNEIVFQAQANETIDSQPFITFDWDNATVGAYTDVWEGMVCFISATTDIRNFKYRGRVRLAPSATEFFIDENATILNDGDYITVIRDTDLFARIRRDTLVDGSIVYHDLPPVTTGLPTSIVLYDSDNDGEVTYTTVQEGIPVDADATAVDIWAWDVSGGGTFSIDDDELQNPTFTFEAGYHYLIRAIFEDDNGTENYQISHVYAVTRTFSAPVVKTVVAGSIQGDLDDGWTASLTAYADVSTLLDRTHVAVFAVERFGDNSSTPIISNVWMNGRIRSDSIQTQGSSEAGQEQQVTFAVEGITAYLRRLRIPNDIVRPTASPNEWGEIEAPNPYRMAIYALWAYTTLTNIASISVETGAFEDWQIGREPRAIDGGSALDVLTALLWETVKAAPNYAPSGELLFAQSASFKADRSGIPVITTFELQDMREYTVDRDSSRTTAQVIAFGGVYDSAANAIVLYTAQAPSIVYGDGGDTRELTRELLVMDSTATDAADEIGLRASNEFAYNNPKPLLRLSLFDSYAGVLIPTNYQRWRATIPTSSNTRGIAYGSSDNWQLQSVTLTINANGAIDASGEWQGETELDDAQTLASLLPNNLSNMNPVLPILPNDPAFPTDALENYPTDTPDLEELQPIDPASAAQAYTPWPPDVAAEIALNQGNANCKTLAVNYRWTSNVTSSWTTVLNDPYLMTVWGSALISNNGWIEIVDLKSTLDGFTVSQGTYTPGTGVVYTDTTTVSGDAVRVAQIERTISSTTVTSVTMTFDLVKGTFTPSSPVAVIYINGGIVATVNPADITDGTGKTLGWSGSTAVTNIIVQGVSSYDGVNPRTNYDGSVILTGLVIAGTGTNPFTGDPGTPLHADAFYTYNLDDEGNEINVALLPGGLYIDNVKYTPVPTAPFPPFDPSHRYGNLPYTGTGNQLNARLVLDNANAQNVYENIQMCRQG